MSGAGGSAESTSSIRLHSPAVDFIDTRLSKYHPVFQHPDAAYDEDMDKFVIKIPDKTGLSVYGPMALVTGPDKAATALSNTAPTQVHPPINSPQTVSFQLSRQITTRQLPPDVVAMEFWQPIWPKAIARLEETAEAAGRIEKGFSIRNANTWEDIKTVLDRARMKYDGLGRDSKWDHGCIARLIGHGRRVGETVASPVQQIIKLVPSHPVATPVLGAVDILMKAWKEATKVRKELTDTFDENTMTSLFADMDQYLDMYPDDQNVVDSSVKLLVAIFNATEGAIGFYIGWRVSRIGRSIFEGEDYLKSFRDSLKHIKVAAGELSKESDKSFQYNQMKSRCLPINHSNKEIIEDETNFYLPNFEGSEIIMLQNEYIMKATNEVYSLLTAHDIQKATSELSFKKSFKPKASIRLTPLPHVATLTHRKELLSPEVISIHSMESRAPTPEPEAQLGPERTHAHQTPLGVLCSSNVDEQDMEAVIDRAGGFPSEDRGRAEQVISTSAFRDWVVYGGSSRLLVHGDYDPNDYPEISPLSVLCVTLVKALRTRPGFVGLAFFCGQHLGQRNDHNTGPRGLMREFVVQMLRQCPSVCPDTPNSNISLSEIENSDLDQLIHLFPILVRKLPTSTTLVVIIDQVHVYERRAYCEGLCKVINMLIKLAEDGELIHNPIKILLTSPTETRTRELYEVFRSQNSILSMRSMPGNGQGPNRSAMAKKIEELGHTSNS
ncbi:hypothetical protein F5B22DRAFT_658718 [Xylaria bambusicola]|uniref:uncharacterized protein n=1 Tax=Xylaria bambusicola TaxID=326684 RepID=UPI002007869D|nr:uncharacterized protein F5B22DRAFT_658718 [Xylaria bambusicola]KAI0508926.1 hypothetical protein F5B22DRAFT_658718 [Xylaria bambusicola]